jgi:antitoxin (DNA-binding transcriptional repressor) of toxin-antitoxin stability system
MIIVNTHEAKTRLSALLKAVEETNETVLICRNGKPVAEVRRPQPGASKDPLEADPTLRVTLHYDPAEPLSEDEWPKAAR